MLRPSAVAELYRGRLRTSWLQELLAAAGIATGVALVFAVLAANTSITNNAGELVGAVAGDAQLQIASRDSAGFVGEPTLAQVRALPEVRDAAPVLEQRAVMRTGGREVGVDLVGVDAALGDLGGVASRPALLGVGLLPGVVVTSATAELLGIASRRSGAPVSLSVRGRSSPTVVSGVFGAPHVGVLATVPFVAAPLGRVQELSGLPGRVTRLLVEAQPGAEERVLAELREIAGPRLNAGHVRDELDALAVATAPNDQATTLFALVAILIGLLLTATAMLLTVPARRREMAQQRIYGYTDRQVATVVLTHAVMLGLPASLVGVAGGMLLATTTSLEPPGYLALAFPIGAEVRLTWWMFAIAIVGGTLATCFAAAQPLLDLRAGRPVIAIYQAPGQDPGQSIAPRLARRLACVSLAMIAATVVATQLWPTTSVIGVGVLVVAALLALPLLVSGLLAVAGLLDRMDRASSLPIAIGSVRAANVRSAALAATCAAAIIGAISIDGARTDLIDGLTRTYSQYVETADVWVAQPGDDLALQPFSSPAARLRRLPGVADVREYYGGLLDIGDRRVWMMARPPTDSALIPRTDVVDGTYEIATAQLREGGWITVSQQLADAHRLGVGDTMRLPTPTGDRAFRVAATTGNLGWGPGAIVMNADDYRRAWATDMPSAIEVDATPGTPPAQVRDRIREALGPDSVLESQTSDERLRETVDIARAGLARLRQIAFVLIIAAAIAIAAAMIATIRDQRPQLAIGMTMGLTRLALWRAMLLETALILLAGCLVGVFAGIYGHYLGGRWLQLMTGYPAPWSWSIEQTVLICVTFAVVALGITAIPGYRSASPPAHEALRGR